MTVAESLAFNPSTVSVALAALAAPVNPAALADLAASVALTDRCVFRNGMAVIKELDLESYYHYKDTCRRPCTPSLRPDLSY